MEPYRTVRLSNRPNKVFLAGDEPISIKIDNLIVYLLSCFRKVTRHQLSSILLLTIGFALPDRTAAPSIRASARLIRALRSWCELFSSVHL